MILVLEQETTDEQVAEVLEELRALGIEARVLRSAERPLVHVVSGPARRAARTLHLEPVLAAVPTSGPRVRREGRRFYPYHFVNWGAVALLAMGALVALAGFLPPGVGEAPGARGELPAGEAPWYAEAHGNAAALLPDGSPWMVWLAGLVALVALFLVPVLDRGDGRGGRLPALVAGGAVLLAVSWVVLA